MHLRHRLAVHLIGLAYGPLLIWPRILHRAYKLAEHTKPPEWRIVAIASDVQLYQIPLKKSTRLWIISAIYHLAIIILIIVQVELTISWNHVQGLNSLTSIGQLIPFILGVGGLLKVVWGKWCLVRRGIKEEIGVQEVPDDYENAMKTYLEWRAVRQKESNAAKHYLEQLSPAKHPQLGAVALKRSNTA